MFKRFEWDEAKNQINMTKHGVDFCYAINIFDDTHRLIWEDFRFDYCEKRYVTIGCIDALCYTVVYTKRRGCIRLISVRRASRDERQTYQKNITKNQFKCRAD